MTISPLTDTVNPKGENHVSQPGSDCRGPGDEARCAGEQSPAMPRALTVALLLQPAQDPEDPSFWDFQGVCLLQVVGKLLPGSQPAYGRFHLSGLTGAFLELLLVIAGEAVPTQLSLAMFNSPSSSLTLPGACSVRPALEQEHRPRSWETWVLVPALLSTSVTMGMSLLCFKPQSQSPLCKMGGNGYLIPVTASHLTSLSFRCSWVKRIKKSTCYRVK